LAAYAAILYYFTMPDKKRTAGLDWEDIRYFVALARYGTLSETARRLRVNHATVARRISSLETLLGRTLFERRPDGYALSAEGKAVLDEARYMDEAALSVLRRLDAGTELSGMVRLTVGRVLAERFLIERLRAFHERYPAIDLEVIGGSRSVSLARRGADIALRVGRRLLASTKRATSLPKPGGLRASLATDGFQFGPPAKRRRLRQHVRASASRFSRDTWQSTIRASCRFCLENASPNASCGS
jgi:DNA-binding transcriptional LysR family regulator